MQINFLRCRRICRGNAWLVSRKWDRQPEANCAPVGTQKREAHWCEPPSWTARANAMWIFPHRETADVETSVRDDSSPTAGARLFHEDQVGKQVKHLWPTRPALNHVVSSLGQRFTAER